MTTDKAKYVSSLLKSIEEIDAKISSLQSILSEVAGTSGNIGCVIKIQKENHYAHELKMEELQMNAIIYDLLELYKEWREEAENKLEQE